jgi:hypothetical protein
LDGQIDVEITATSPRSGDDRKWETDSIGSNSKILKTTVVSSEWEEAQRQSRDDQQDEIEVLKWAVLVLTIDSNQSNLFSLAQNMQHYKIDREVIWGYVVNLAWYETEAYSSAAWQLVPSE